MSYKPEKLKPFHTDFKVGDLITFSKTATGQGSGVFLNEYSNPNQRRASKLEILFTASEFVALVMEPSYVHNIIWSPTAPGTEQSRTDKVYTKRKVTTLIRDQVLIPVMLNTTTIHLSDVYFDKYTRLFTEFGYEGKERQSIPALLWNSDGGKGTQIYFQNQFLLAYDQATNNRPNWYQNVQKRPGSKDPLTTNLCGHTFDLHSS
ncbi:hypothetical protein HN803_05230 [candidate division WWE3 bacterium]|jgi:hypothetical protein|nr:hypothetical protein [candidate division WWE3 bacterium]